VRPLRLELEGFTSFREKAILDLDGLDLFAITGPTGAGKSSLIDAMIFALYGQVPRVGGEYRQLVSHGAERLSVRLDFKVGKDDYRVVRAIRKSGPAQTRLERIRNGRPEPLADRVKDISEQVERLLGLDYDAFTRSVVLPQGQFDAFLKGEPKERRKILVALLELGVYERMQEAVNRKAADARREAEFIASQLDRDYAQATPEALRAKEAERSAAEAARSAAEKTQAALRRGAAAAQKLRLARREAESVRRALADEGEKARRAEEALAGRAADRDRLAAARAVLAEKTAAAAFDEPRHLTLVGARPQARRLAELQPKLARLDKALQDGAAALALRRKEATAADKAVGAAEKAAATAQEAALAARARREAVHREHAAHELRRALRPGEPCPVCTQAVVLVPPARVEGLEAVDAAVKSAEREAEGARRRVGEAQLAAQRLASEVERLASERAQAEELAREAKAETAALADALAGAAFRRRDLGDPAALVAALERELADLDRTKAEGQRLAGERQRLDAEAAALEGRLAAATAQRDEARKRIAEAEGRQAESQRAFEDAEAAFASLVRREGWDAGSTRTRPSVSAGGDEADWIERLSIAAQDEHAAHSASAARAAAQADEIRKKLERAGELRERKKTLESEGGLASALALHLRADQFLAYVQEEALRILAQDGSRHLRQLSQGRYSLCCEAQEFFVLDHWNADSRRSVKTLSGGESFLASLALALALAESLAELSALGRAGEALESLFLDEGFGTLDPETLSQVVQALEQLQGGQRMVGLVTHIPELAEQMPARVEVGRSDTGATVAVV
jgi:DNA repair protein SbcC/Rad50